MHRTFVVSLPELVPLVLIILLAIYQDLLRVEGRVIDCVFVVDPSSVFVHLEVGVESRLVGWRTTTVAASAVKVRLLEALLVVVDWIVEVLEVLDTCQTGMLCLSEGVRG